MVALLPRRRPARPRWAPDVDAITVIYLLTLGGVAVLLGALASRNTFAADRRQPGDDDHDHGRARPGHDPASWAPSRRGSLGLGTAVLHGTAGARLRLSPVVMIVVYLLALQAFVGRQPFDIAEAEIEILEGPFIEYSGPDYALFQYYMMMKQMFYA